MQIISLQIYICFIHSLLYKSLIIYNIKVWYRLNITFSGFIIISDMIILSYPKKFNMQMSITSN